MPPIDEERADLEVLQDNLAKTTRLSDRMGEILTAFDARLEQLDRAVRKINASGEGLKRVQGNVDETIRAIERTRQYYNIPFEEEERIRRGPLNDPAGYLRSLARIDHGIQSMRDDRLEASRKIASRMQALQQDGNKQIAEHVDRAVRDNSRQIEPLPFVLKDQSLPAIPTDQVDFLAQVASSSQPARADLLARYVSARSTYLQRSLHTFVLASQRNLEIRTQTLYERENNGIGHYSEALTRMCLVEREAALRIFAPEGSRVWGAVVDPALGEYLATTKSIAGHVQGRLSTDCYLAFETLEHMSRFRARVRLETPELLRDVDANVALVASSCAPAFHDLMEDVRRRADQLQVLPGDAGVLEIARELATRLVRFSHYRDTVLDLIFNLGDGQWRHPLQGPIKLNKANPPEQAVALFDTWAAEVVALALQQLENKSRQLGRKPGFTGVLCLNNVAYVQSQIVRGELASMTPRQVPAKVDELMRRGFKLYRESWDVSARPLMDTTVMRNANDAKRSSFTNKDRDALKERFRTFNTEFEASIRDCKTYAVHDPDLKQHLTNEIRGVIVPLYGRFYDKYVNAEFTKNKEKYIKYDKSSIEKVIWDAL